MSFFSTLLSACPFRIPQNHACSPESSNRIIRFADLFRRIARTDLSKTVQRSGQQSFRRDRFSGRFRRAICVLSSDAINAVPLRCFIHQTRESISVKEREPFYGYPPDGRIVNFKSALCFLGDRAAVDHRKRLKRREGKRFPALSAHGRRCRRAP